MNKQTLAARDRLFGAWDKFGYSEKFEIISEYQGRYKPIKYRCKICGAVSEKQASTISVSHSNLRCSNCWIHRDDETIAPRDYQLTQHLADAYSNGDTVASIAKTYNLDERVVSRLIKETSININPNRVCYIKQRQEENQWKHDAKASEKRIESEFKAIKKDIGEWRKSIGVFEDSLSVFNTEQKAFDDWLSGEYYCYKSRLIEYEPQLAVCKHCGKQWIFWPSREKYSHHKPPTYCSKKCNYKHFKTGNIPDRLRKYGREKEPRDTITLKETIRRNAGVCYLCGCKTNEDDCWHDVNGCFVAGDTYPTRDHVIPIVRGGKHRWFNVALACRACNSRKNDMMLKEYAAYMGYSSSFLREVGRRLFARLQ